MIITLLLLHCHSAQESVEASGIAIALLPAKGEQEPLILAHFENGQGFRGFAKPAARLKPAPVASNKKQSRGRADISGGLELLRKAPIWFFGNAERVSRQPPKRRFAGFLL
jgi:hypothetical protein